MIRATPVFGNLGIGSSFFGGGGSWKWSHSAASLETVGLPAPSDEGNLQWLAFMWLLGLSSTQLQPLSRQTKSGVIRC